MTEQTDHPGYAPWSAPTETYLDQDDLPDSRAIKPDFFLRFPTIPPLPANYRRPRQCLIEDDDAISFSMARKILEHRWNTSPAEILLWLNSEPSEIGRLHVFSSHHAIFFSAFGRRFYWRKPGGEGLVRPCVGLGSQDEPDDCTDAERLSYYLFSRAEVEAFDPALNEDDSEAEIEYYVGGSFNPSGRYLSFDQALDFLCRYEPNREILVGLIRREFGRHSLIALKPCADLLIPHASAWLNFFPNARPDEGHFFEGQIVGLAKDEFGADVQRWDAASRPDRIGSVIAPQARGRISTSEQARERANKKHASTNELKAKALKCAEPIVARGKMNHSQLAQELKKNPELSGLSKSVLNAVAKQACTDTGRTDLVLGHPDYRAPC